MDKVQESINNEVKRQMLKDVEDIHKKTKNRKVQELCAQFKKAVDTEDFDKLWADFLLIVGMHSHVGNKPY